MEEDEGDSREIDGELNSVNCLELLFSDVTHLGELRGLPIVDDESTLQDIDRFKFVRRLTASVSKQQNLVG